MNRKIKGILQFYLYLKLLLWFTQQFMMQNNNDAR